MGFRRLEQRAAASGQALPRSTITSALNRDTLPREDLVVALVRACGGDQDEVDRWVAARRRIAAARPPESTVVLGSSPEQPPAPRSRPAPVMAMLIAIGVLIGAGVGVYAMANAQDLAARGRAPVVEPTAGQGRPPGASPAPVNRALALFAAAEKLAQDGRPRDAQAALGDAVRLYDELLRLSPEENGPFLAPAVIRALDGIGVDFSVPEADLRDWLANPDYTPYPALAQTLLRSGWRLKAPVHLDVIWWNYQQTPGVADPRQVADVRPAVLRAAILQGYNARHGENVMEFDQLLRP
nr:hypothetical protein [Micromonospora sp. DSM 115978]